ncbi:hypothetical protein [Sphingomonas bacterium]|uniref:hypothetical protein n=1 Tax=Sphingomonas bacterium TaxID=1895847 RepID=UPI0026122EF5|nr:hypothetical protein [Sphingomonas bacterium]MDB5680087.1 hypothetical protein [Sphingomonas bacterium]
MIAVLLALALQSAAPAPSPAVPAPVCTVAVAPPAGLEAWNTISAVTTGPIAIGQGTGLMLQPVAKVVFTPTPNRAPKPGTFGGVYQFNVTTAGTYRIALDAGAWIDVVGNGKALVSTAHTEGAPCSGIRKIVDFTLAAGRYTLQLSGAKEAPMRILIAAK